MISQISSQAMTCIIPRFLAPWFNRTKEQYITIQELSGVITMMHSNSLYPRWIKILLLVSFLSLAACGGGGGSDSDDPVETDCIIGTSTIGNCEI